MAGQSGIRAGSRILSVQGKPICEGSKNMIENQRNSNQKTMENENNDTEKEELKTPENTENNTLNDKSNLSLFKYKTTVDIYDILRNDRLPIEMTLQYDPLLTLSVQPETECTHWFDTQNDIARWLLNDS